MFQSGNLCGFLEKNVMEREMNINLDIKITAKDLFRFNMNQAYKGTQGILSIVLPILIFAYAVTTYGDVSIGSTLVYVGLGIVFLVYVPVSLWMRSKKVVLDPNNALSKALHYTFTEEGIRVSVEEESVELKWEHIYQIRTTGDLLLIHTNRIHAYILPLAQVGDNYDVLSQLVHAKLEKYRIKMYKENKLTSM